MSFVRRAAIGALLCSVVGIGGIAVGEAHAAGPVLTVSATAPPDPLGPTDTFTATVTVTNTGDTDSAATLLTTYVPKAKTGTAKLVYATKSGIVCSSYTPRYGYNQRRCTVPALAPGQSITLATIAGTPPALIPFAGTTATASVAGAANPLSLAWHWLQPGPTDLAASGYASPTMIFVGGTSTGTITVTDNAYGAAGPFLTHIGRDLAADITMGTLPAGVACAAVSDGVDCTFDGLANGHSAALPFTVAPLTTGTLTLTVDVDTTAAVVESDEANNTFALSPITIVGSAASFAETISQPATVDKGSVFTRSVTVTNNGGSPADNVSFVDRFTQFPIVARLSDPACHAYITYSGRPTKAHYNGVACTVGTLAAGTSRTFSYVLSVPTTLAVNTFTDTVTVSTTSFQAPTSVPTASSSVTTAVPASPVAPTALTLPTIAGNAVAGEVLTATGGTWIGTPTITTSFQWQRCNAAGGACVDIPGASGPAYTVAGDDAGSTLRAVQTAVNGGGATPATSGVSALVIGSTAPSNTVAPTLIAGLEKQPGFAWSVNKGTWSGTPTITYGYQWYRCNIGGGGCVVIPGATTAGYILQTADVFHSVQVLVTATNSAGSGTAWSNVSPEIDPFG